MNSDSEEAPGRLPENIGQAVSQGEFERVKAWLAAGSASDPRSINAGDDSTSWTLLHWTMNGDQTPGHLEFARYLLSRGARVDAKTYQGSTALHFACSGAGETTAAMISMLVAAGAAVNAETHGGRFGAGHGLSQQLVGHRVVKGLHARRIAIAGGASGDWGESCLGSERSL